MATYLTLEYDGQEKTMADWGIELASCLGVNRSLYIGQYQLTIPVASIAIAPHFPFEAPVIIRRNRLSATGAPNTFSGGSIAFQGKRLSAQHQHNGSSARIAYLFVNAWYDLENTIYQQEVANQKTAVNDLDYPFVSNLTLFEELDDSAVPQLVPLTTGQQIQRILQFLLDRYAEQGLAAPYQIGTITPAMLLPAFDTQQMTCADAIRKCLELHPEAVFSILYTSTPPTIEVRGRGNTGVATLPYASLSSATNVKEFSIRKRDDLVPRSVIVHYRITHTQNGVDLVSYVTDKYGPNGQDSDLDPNSGLRVVIHTLDMTGSSYSAVHLTADLDVEPVLCNGTAAQRLAWWLDARGGGRIEKQIELDAGDIQPNSIAINDASILDDDGNAINLASYPNAIIDTPVQTWMQYENAPIETVNAKLVADVLWYDRNNNLVVSKFTQQLTLTNAIAGTYRYDSVQSAAGENLPGFVEIDGDGNAVFANGLAQKLYENMAEAQFESDHVRVAGVCPGDLTLSQRVNITGGLGEWAAAGMLIQELVENDGLGETAVRLGPVRKYDAGQLVDIWRFTRWFRWLGNFTGRETGNPDGSTISM